MVRSLFTPRRSLELCQQRRARRLPDPADHRSGRDRPSRRQRMRRFLRAARRQLRACLPPAGVSDNGPGPRGRRLARARVALVGCRRGVRAQLARERARLASQVSTSYNYAWTDITYLLHKAGVSWGYFVTPGGEPDCEGGNANCSSAPLSVGTPDICFRLWMRVGLFTPPIIPAMADGTTIFRDQTTNLRTWENWRPRSGSWGCGPGCGCGRFARRIPIPSRCCCPLFPAEMNRTVRCWILQSKRTWGGSIATSGSTGNGVMNWSSMTIAPMIFLASGECR